MCEINTENTRIISKDNEIPGSLPTHELFCPQHHVVVCGLFPDKALDEAALLGHLW